MLTAVGKEYRTTDVYFVLTPELFGLVRHKSLVHGCVNVGFIEVNRRLCGVFVAVFRYRATYDDLSDLSLVPCVQAVFIRLDDNDSLFDLFVGRNESDILFVVEITVVFKDVFVVSFVVILALFSAGNGKVITT